MPMLMSHDPFTTIKNFPKKRIEKLRWKKGLNLIRIWCSSPYFYIILSLLVFNIRVLHSLSNCPFERERESYTTFLSSLSLSHFHINERRLFSSISSPYLSVESFLEAGNHCSNTTNPRRLGCLRLVAQLANLATG